MNLDSCSRGQSSQQNSKIAAAQRNAAFGRPKAGTRDVNEHGTPTTGNARPRIVVDFDNQIIEMVVSAQAIAWFIGRAAKWPIIAPVGGVLAPSVRRADWATWQERSGTESAICLPP